MSPATPTAPSTAKSLGSFALAVVAVVLLLAWWQGWALPLVIGCVFFIVMAHEFGHYVTARLGGMSVSDFFVGFGPVLWSTQRKGTRYGVRALLLGGYVKVPGMTWGDPLAPELERGTYRAASYPRKVLFASAGSLMHGVMAVALAWASLTFVGAVNPSAVEITGFAHWDGHHQNAAQLAGLHLGDVVTSVAGEKVTSMVQVIALTREHADRAMALTVERNGRVVHVVATPADGRTLREGGVRVASGKTPVGYLGVELQTAVQTQSWYAAVPHAFTFVGSMTADAVRSMVHVLSPGEFASLYHQAITPKAARAPSNQDTRPVSIVGVVRIADQAAQSNTRAFFNILIALNIFVGLVNMLPMLPLDGGYVAIATYERLRSRRARAYQADLNKLTPVVYAFVAVLLALFFLTLYLDIVYPIANPFAR